MDAQRSTSPESEPLDLLPFCGREESRPYLMKPFARDGFTWATDGRILVRVPRRIGDQGIEEILNLAVTLRGLDDAKFYQPRYRLPPAPTETGPCPACDGRGCEHDCPHCGCECRKCSGRGDLDPERMTSTTIGTRTYALAYVRLMLSLPRVELAEVKSDKARDPLLFRFEGGVGCLMPMSSPFETHVELETSAEAN